MEIIAINFNFSAVSKNTDTFFLESFSQRRKWSQSQGPGIALLSRIYKPIGLVIVYKLHLQKVARKERKFKLTEVCTEKC